MIWPGKSLLFRSCLARSSRLSEGASCAAAIDPVRAPRARKRVIFLKNIWAPHGYGTSTVKGDDPLRGSEIDAIGHADKQAMVDHARQVGQGPPDRDRIRDPAEAAVSEEVAIVADHRLALPPA